MNTRASSEVAIVGAGLAGLSAARILSQRVPNARVTILEKEPRIGGRVLTSYRPDGEHGPEFVLKSECTVEALLKALGVRKAESLDYSACRYKGRRARGSLRKMAKQTLNKNSFDAVARVLAEAQKALIGWSSTPPTTRRPGGWSNGLAETREPLGFFR